MSTTAAALSFAIQLAIAEALLNALPSASYPIEPADLHLCFAKNDDDPYEGIAPEYGAIQRLEIFIDANGNRNARVHFDESTGKDSFDLWMHGDSAAQDITKVIEILSAGFESIGVNPERVIKKAVLNEIEPRA